MRRDEAVPARDGRPPQRNLRDVNQPDYKKIYEGRSRLTIPTVYVERDEFTPDNYHNYVFTIVVAEQLAVRVDVPKTQNQAMKRPNYGTF